MHPSQWTVIAKFVSLLWRNLRSLHKEAYIAIKQEAYIAIKQKPFTELPKFAKLFSPQKLAAESYTAPASIAP